MIWATGTPTREFLHVDDVAAASLFVISLEAATFNSETQKMLCHINVGTGTDVTIKELAQTIATIVGFNGKLTFDTSKPDGAPRKLMDVSRLERMG